MLFSGSLMSNSLWPHGLQHARLPCPSPSPGACSNSCPLSQWCHPTISSSVVPFSSCPPSFPASGYFPVSQLFTSGGQSIGASASASVLPMNIQSWFPLGLTGLIALQSMGLKSLLQHHSSKAPILWCSAVFMVQLSLLYMTTGKTLALTTWIFVVKYYVYFTTVFKHHNYRALGETYIWTEENAAGQGKADKRTAFFPVLVPHGVLRHHFTSSPVLQPGTVISNILSAAKWEHECLRACDVMESLLWGKQVHRASAKSPTSSRLDSRGGPGRGLNAVVFPIHQRYIWQLVVVQYFGGREGKMCVVKTHLLFSFSLLGPSGCLWHGECPSLFKQQRSSPDPQNGGWVRRWAVGNNLQLDGPVPKGDPWRELGPRTRGPGHAVTSEDPGPWGLCQPLPSSSCQY